VSLYLLVGAIVLAAIGTFLSAFRSAERGEIPPSGSG